MDIAITTSAEPAIIETSLKVADPYHLDESTNCAMVSAESMEITTKSTPHLMGLMGHKSSASAGRYQNISKATFAKAAGHATAVIDER